MLYVIVLIGLLFIGIGFVLTENNARFLLAGYNTMPEEKQKKFNLRNYLVFFRRFHIFLGISFIVFGLLVATLVDEPYSTVFIVGYPILLYVYLIVKGNTFWRV